MIPHSKFHALRLSQFRKDTEIAELEDWEYEERIWVGEAIKFSEWLRTVEDPEALGSLAILIREIDHNLQLLKRHSPYHESDHVLNIAFNILAGDKRIEHLELRRRWRNHGLASIHSSSQGRPAFGVEMSHSAPPTR